MTRRRRVGEGARACPGGDEVNEFNGPLMFVPGSQKLGVIEVAHDVTTTSYPLWTIGPDTIRKLVERGGLVAPKGRGGR